MSLTWEISTLDREIDRPRLRGGRPCVSETSQVPAAKYLPLGEVERRRAGPRSFRPDCREWEVPSVVFADEPGVDRPLKAMGKPNKRRNVESALGIAEIEGGSERSDRMQGEIASLREAWPIREAKALPKGALKRCDHQSCIAHRERPIAEPLRPRSIWIECLENIPRRCQALCHKLRREIPVPFEDDKRGN